MNKKLIKYIITEYGLNWTFYRFLYLAKIKLLRMIPSLDKLFEKKVTIGRTDIFSLDIEEIKKFLKILPKEKQDSIIKEADNAILGKLTGFSSISIDYGIPINWHLQPFTQKEVDKSLKWYCIPDFDKERGDIKVIWEASRFTHFYLFSRAYLITGEKKYYKAFSEQLKLWLENNEYSYGANFKCGQESSLRMINTLMNYSVFKYEGLISYEDEENVKELVKRCYKKVRSNFFYAKHMKNNHTFSEIAGLIVGAWCSEDGKALRQGYTLLEKEIRKQFYFDGGYIQYSFNYQRFSLQIIECILKCEEKTNISLSIEALNRIKNSVLQLYQMQDEISEDVPNYGANDGALIFPVTTCDYRNFTPIINTLYLSITGNRLYNYGEHDEEILWFSDYKIHGPIENINKESTAFNDSGFYTIRRKNGFLMVACHSYEFRPFHMDGMHIDLWHKGKNIFCDSGTYSYASDLGKEMVKTTAHNTVKLQGIEQMKAYSNFLVYKWSDCRDIKHNKDYFRGTMISKNGYTHFRSIKKTKQGYTIMDLVSGKCDYCESNFHTPCDVKKTIEGFELYDEGKLMCSVITTGIVEIKKVYRSIYYLRKDEINCISIKSTFKGDNCSIRFDINLEYDYLA